MMKRSKSNVTPWYDKRMRKVLFVVLFFAAGGHSLGQSPANVLVVINEASPASIEIGNYYAQKRHVPAENLLRLQVNPGESIERADYERQIEAPIAIWLARNFAQDR